MRIWLTNALLVATFISVHAQQPEGKGPTLPPVNPATAKLDITISDLDGPGFAIATGPDDFLVVALENGTLQGFKKGVIAATKGSPKEQEVWKGHQGPVRCLAWTGGPTLVSAGIDKKLNFRKMPQGKDVQTATVDYRIRAMAMTNDGKTLATAGESDVIQLWDVAAGKPTVKLTDKMDWTYTLAFSADGKQLLSGDHLGVVRLWDATNGKKVRDLPAAPMPPPKPPLPDPVPVTCVAFAPDGKSIVLGNADGVLQMINLGDGKSVRALVGHTGPITGFVFHPSGTLAASCSKDRTVKLWNPAAPQPAVQALKSLDGHAAWIEGIVFIDQGTKLATVGADATLRIWDLSEPPKKK